MVHLTFDSVLETRKGISNSFEPQTSYEMGVTSLTFQMKDGGMEVTCLRLHVL